MQEISQLLSGLDFSDGEPRLLQHSGRSIAVGRYDKRKLVLAQIGTDVIILIGGRGIQVFGYYPDLVYLIRFCFASFLFAVVVARACTHCLDVAYGDGTAVLLAVAMLQLAFQVNGDKLHVLMRMGSEAFSRSYPVVVQNAQVALIHAAGVVILVKTE